MCLFCHVNPYGLVVRESRGLMGGSPFMVSHYAAKFSDHRDCGSGDRNIHTNGKLTANAACHIADCICMDTYFGHFYFL